jgi:DNA polymerase-4
MRERSIIHLNVADFAVAVERIIDSRLRERPVIIAPNSAPRAAVYDMSEEAYQSGVRKGMILKNALRYCRDASVLPPHLDRYERAMESLLKYSRPYSPLIELADHNGHVFIDVTGTGRLFGSAPDIAWRIRKTTKKNIGLDPVWSVAPNKLVAKVATRIVKPSGEYIVKPGEEQSFLEPLPAVLIPGITREDANRLREFSMLRAGHVAALSMDQLDVIFGKRSVFLYEAVRGIDSSPVTPIGQNPPMVTYRLSFKGDTNDNEEVQRALYGIVEQAGTDLRKQHLTARRVGIILDYTDGFRSARQASLNPPAADNFRLFAAARTALNRAWKRRVRIRHLCLICNRLIRPSGQLMLFAAEKNQEMKHQQLCATMDTIRVRFGSGAIRTGRTFHMTAS